ncbi:uncharacterized protein [Engystomops pustulosus]|uniref:uncharacterized protein n=1 Tax=Engystomops pustulosus TaxID=76066 RepID=UPI003AFB0228
MSCVKAVAVLQGPDKTMEELMEQLRQSNLRHEQFMADVRQAQQEVRRQTTVRQQSMESLNARLRAENSMLASSLAVTSKGPDAKSKSTVAMGNQQEPCWGCLQVDRCMKGCPVAKRPSVLLEVPSRRSNTVATSKQPQKRMDTWDRFSATEELVLTTQHRYQTPGKVKSHPGIPGKTVRGFKGAGRSVNTVKNKVAVGLGKPNVHNYGLTKGLVKCACFQGLGHVSIDCPLIVKPSAGSDQKLNEVRGNQTPEPVMTQQVQHLRKTFECTVGGIPLGVSLVPDQKISKIRPELIMFLKVVHETHKTVTLNFETEFGTVEHELVKSDDIDVEIVLGRDFKFCGKILWENDVLANPDVYPQETNSPESAEISQKEPASIEPLPDDNVCNDMLCDDNVTQYSSGVHLQPHSAESVDLVVGALELVEMENDIDTSVLNNSKCLRARPEVVTGDGENSLCEKNVQSHEVNVVANGNTENVMTMPVLSPNNVFANIDQLSPTLTGNKDQMDISVGEENVVVNVFSNVTTQDREVHNGGEICTDHVTLLSHNTCAGDGGDAECCVEMTDCAVDSGLTELSKSSGRDLSLHSEKRPGVN